MTQQRVQVQTWLNDGPGRFRAYEPGDKLYQGPVVTIEVDADQLVDTKWVQALDRTWVVGNRMDADADNLPWPSYVRSLSSGDVLTLRPFQGGPVLTWGIEAIGFRALGVMKDVASVDEPQSFALAVSVSEYGKVSDRGAFGPPAKSEAEAGLV